MKIAHGHNSGDKTLSSATAINRFALENGVDSKIEYCFRFDYLPFCTLGLGVI